MTFRLEFDSDGVARLISDDDVVAAEVEAAALALYSHPRFAPPSRVLWDLRSGRGRLSRGELGKLVAFFRANRPAVAGRAAILVADDLSFGLSRMFQQLSSDVLPVEIQVFRQLDSALAWLREDAASWGS